MDNERLSHDALQRSYFDRNAEFFTQPIPEEVQDRTRQIVLSACLGENSRVLDVGTGAGALIDYFLDNGVKEQNVVGCDICRSMLDNARERHPNIHFWQGDIVDFPENQG